MKKLVNWSQDFTPELLEQYNNSKIEEFNKEQKQEKREESHIRIIAYCSVGLLLAVSLFAIIRTEVEIILTK